MSRIARGLSSPRNCRSSEEIKSAVHAKLVETLDRSPVQDPGSEAFDRQFRPVAGQLLDHEMPLLSRLERERLLDEILAGLAQRIVPRPIVVSGGTGACDAEPKMPAATPAPGKKYTPVVRIASP